MAQQQAERSLVSGSYQDVEIAMIQAAVKLTERATGGVAKDVEKHYRQMYTAVVESYNKHHYA